jgi:hypothetical protein
MSTRHATTTMPVDSCAVLDALTDRAACLSWCPVAVDVDGPRRFCAGSQARISGSVVGRPVVFDLDVLTADARCFALCARGPFTIEATYRFEPDVAHGTNVRLEIRTSSPRGLTGRLAVGAVDALLGSGFMDVALDRIRCHVLDERCRLSALQITV